MNIVNIFYLIESVRCALCRWVLFDTNQLLRISHWNRQEYSIFNIYCWLQGNEGNWKRSARYIWTTSQYESIVRVKCSITRLDDAVIHVLQLQSLPIHLENGGIWADVNFVCARGHCSQVFRLIFFLGSSRNNRNYRIINQSTNQMSHSVKRFQMMCAFSIRICSNYNTEYFSFAAMHNLLEKRVRCMAMIAHTHWTIVAFRNGAVACQAQENVLQLPVTGYACIDWLLPALTFGAYNLSVVPSNSSNSCQKCTDWDFCWQQTDHGKSQRPRHATSWW